MIVLSGLRIRFVLDGGANGRNRKNPRSTMLTTMSLSGLSSRAMISGAIYIRFTL
jgi:hypothetical protein